MVRKIILYTDFADQIEQYDVTNENPKNYRIHTASGVVKGGRGFDVKAFLRSTTGLGVYKELFICPSCNSSLET